MGKKTGMGTVCLTAALLAIAFGVFQGIAQKRPKTYEEPFRPQVSFSPEKNWTNDPNGLVYFDGEYHLFFQYNPFGDQWGHMSWGHAVSRDLLHWKELPVAIPEGDGEMIFTGSVVVDEKNTSGLCQNGKACLVAIYTGNRGEGTAQREVQDLASSQDGGHTWQKYPGNPVLNPHMVNFRDPSVTWNEASNSWLMTVALPDEHRVAFYTSPDLKKWVLRSTFGHTGAMSGVWECPDLLRIPDRSGKSSVWALKVGLNPGALQGGSGEQYFLGYFDGVAFNESKASGGYGWTDYGKDSYCAISFNHLPAGEPPTLLGWMNNWQYASKQPTSPWRGQMTLARHITLIRDKAGVAVSQEPVIAPLRISPATRVRKHLGAGLKVADISKGDSPAEMQLTFVPNGSRKFGLHIYSDASHWTDVVFNLDKSTFSVDRTQAGLDIAPEFPAKTDAPLVDGRPLDLDLILDRSSVSAFAQEGTIAMTNLVFPPTPNLRVVLYQDGKDGQPSVEGQAWKLRSIWSDSGTTHHTARKRKVSRSQR